MNNRFQLVKAGNLRGLVAAGLWEELPMPHKLYVVKKASEQTQQAVDYFAQLIEALNAQTPPELIRDESLEEVSKSVRRSVKPDQNRILEEIFPFNYFHKEQER